MNRSANVCTRRCVYSTRYRMYIYIVCSSTIIQTHIHILTNPSRRIYIHPRISNLPIPSSLINIILYIHTPTHTTMREGCLLYYAALNEGISHPDDVNIIGGWAGWLVGWLTGCVLVWCAIWNWIEIEKYTDKYYLYVHTSVWVSVCVCVQDKQFCIETLFGIFMVCFEFKMFLAHTERWSLCIPSQ